ncbi:MAG: DUF3048 domain-containing protein [Chloroflexi bacterium]|nr:DUF3048 domain-containing protein [Chloroflexota bacterium]
MPSPAVTVLPAADPAPPSRPAPPPAPTPAGAPTQAPAGPPGVNPLTGLPVSDPALLDRRPLAIKVANSPRIVRPQSGLSLADLVFEHIAEGGNTRLTAIFLGSDAEQVGPIRSARLIDLELPAMYKAVFAFSGASTGTRDKLIRADFVTRAFSEIGAGPGPWMFRVDPNDLNVLMANTAALEQLSVERGNTTGHQNLSGLRFDPTPPNGGQPANTVNLHYSAETYNEWRFDLSTGRYLRLADDKEGGYQQLTDALTGQPISAANVAVVYAPAFLTDILEDDQGLDLATGAGGHYGFQIQLWGSGPAVVFRDGLAYPVTWVRFGRDGTLGFVVSGDQVLPFKPGNTWVELVGVSTVQNAVNGAWTFEHKTP